jgi:lipoprotein-anchoring transpeptidase ErfK/SrfK
MRLRTTLLVALTAALATTAAQAQTTPTTTTTTTPTAPAKPARPAPRVIASGVTAGGIPLSGLTVAQATAKLQDQATAQATRPLALDVAGRAFHLSAARAGLTFYANATAKAALAAPPTPASHGGGTVAGTDVPLDVGHSHAAVATFVRSVAGEVTTAPQNATLKIGLQHQRVRRARLGHTLDATRTTALVDAALDDATGARELHVATTTIHPQINANDIARQNPTIVTVDRAHFVLRLFKHLRMVKSYPIAVGMAGLETPTGVYHVQDKQVNPSWHVPNSPWAGALAGQVIPPGPADPIVARWMGLADGVGIHGTNEPWTVGSAASHGCIRMRPADVIALYPRVPVGTPVLIA